MSVTKSEIIPFYEGELGSWQIKIGRRALDSLELARRFNLLAKSWHQMLRRLGYHAAYDDLWSKLFASQSLPFRRTKMLSVLDCGVGTGCFSAALARSWRGSLRLCGVDVSAQMLAEARRLHARQGVAIDLRCSDVRSLPYADDKFDLVVSAHVLEHLGKPLSALEEMRRVLKPGGWLVIGATRDSLVGRYIHFKWRTHLCTPNKLSGWAASAGLEIVANDVALTGIFSKASIVCVARKPL